MSIVIHDRDSCEFLSRWHICLFSLTLHHLTIHCNNWSLTLKSFVTRFKFWLRGDLSFVPLFFTLISITFFVISFSFSLLSLWLLLWREKLLPIRGYFLYRLNFHISYGIFICCLTFRFLLSHLFRLMFLIFKGLFALILILWIWFLCISQPNISFFCFELLLRFSAKLLLNLFSICCNWFKI